MRYQTALIAIAAFALPLAAQAQNISLYFAYGSAYYWRGNSAPDGSVQPSADLSYNLAPGLSARLNAWIAQAPKYEPNDDRSTDFTSEINYTAALNYKLNGNLNLRGGIIDYVIPVGAPFEEGHTLEAHIAADAAVGRLNLSLAYYINVNGDDLNSFYILPQISYPLDHLTFALTLGAGNGVYAQDPDAAALVDITPSAAYDIPLGENMQANIRLAVGYNPDRDAATPFFSFGTGWNWSP